MYRAKSDGKARIAVFDRSMEARALERMEVETSIFLFARPVPAGEIEVLLAGKAELPHAA